MRIYLSKKKDQWLKYIYNNSIEYALQDIEYTSHILFVFCLFVCLVFSSHSRIFHLYGDITIAAKGLQMLTYARHLWGL